LWSWEAAVGLAVVTGGIVAFVVRRRRAAAAATRPKVAVASPRRKAVVGARAPTSPAWAVENSLERARSAGSDSGVGECGDAGARAKRGARDGSRSATNVARCGSVVTSGVFLSATSWERDGGSGNGGSSSAGGASPRKRGTPLSGTPSLGTPPSSIRRTPSLVSATTLSPLHASRRPSKGSLARAAAAVVASPTAATARAKSLSKVPRDVAAPPSPIMLGAPALAANEGGTTANPLRRLRDAAAAADAPERADSRRTPRRAPNDATV